jgi:diketogulonate reductase-like aldo/keto reductase
MPGENLIIEGIRVPRFLYGTAWKENETQQLTQAALRQGFRGIDTANQRRHYHEAAVGQAIAAATRDATLVREELFLQSKFTFRQGQDHRLPYDPQAPVRMQVEQSFAKSLEHLGTDYLDSYLLHAPASRVGLSADDWAAWQAMEAIHDSERARLLGISNVTLEQLELLCRHARVRPHFVQNRCFAVIGWDRSIRQYCAAQAIAYQGFSLLTANRDALAHPDLARIAARHGRMASQIIFRFAVDLGMIALTGTSNREHMRADLEVFEFSLDPEEVERIEGLLLYQS